MYEFESGLERRSLWPDIQALIEAGRILVRTELDFQRTRFFYARSQLLRTVAALAASLLMLGLSLFALIVGAVVSLAADLSSLRAAATVAACVLLLAAALVVLLGLFRHRIARA